MKKLITVILILSLLLPAAAMTEELGIVGCWSHYELQTTGAPEIKTLYLAEDYTCYFIIQAFKPDGPGLGRSYVGTWELLDDGSVYAKTGKNTDMILRFADGYYVAYDVTMNEYYLNLDIFQLE